MKFVVKPIVCDYGVIWVDTGELVCICNIKSNAELIADILNGDHDNSCAYAYYVYPNAKYIVVKAESEDKEEINPYEKCKTCGQNMESCCGCPEVLELEQKKRTRG